MRHLRPAPTLDAAKEVRLPPPVRAQGGRRRPLCAVVSGVDGAWRRVRRYRYEPARQARRRVEDVLLDDLLGQAAFGLMEDGPSPVPRPRRFQRMIRFCEEAVAGRARAWNSRPAAPSRPRPARRRPGELRGRPRLQLLRRPHAPLAAYLDGLPRAFAASAWPRRSLRPASSSTSCWPLAWKSACGN